MTAHQSRPSSPGRAQSSTRRSKGSRRHRPQGEGGSARFAAGRIVPKERLRDLVFVTLRLRAIYGAAITAELALRQQAAEQDSEISACLRFGVCDPISDQIQALEHFIRLSNARGPRDKP